MPDSRGRDRETWPDGLDSCLDGTITALQEPRALPRLVFLGLVLLATPATAEIVRSTFAQAYSLGEDETELDVQAYEALGPAVGAALGLRVNRLEIEPVEITLEAGETYSLRELRIRAFGREGVLVERAPLALELEAPDNVIGLALFAIDGHSIRAIQPGIARLWVSSLIPTRRGDTFRLPVVLIVTGQRTLAQPAFLF